ncbi:hypothetical protein [Sulfurimonas sp. HSL-1716]|uniref:hypothetical protein n=1 Tax=Hydrocurvibacter sulfurireducens TaxID=3131937 RepID=UPI0031F9A622
MKIFLTIIIVFLSLINISTYIDSAALALHDLSFQRSLAAFGIAKALNAVISVFQGTEFSFSPMGMGVNISIGEILDPLNDLIERFSWLMLAATISIGVQKFFLLIGTKLFVQLAFIFSSVFLMMLLWIKNFQDRRWVNISVRIFIVMFIFRFATILFIYLNQFVYTSLLENDYNNASVVLTKTDRQLDKEFALQQTNAQDLGQIFDVRQKLQTLKSIIDDASRQIITLSAIFVLSSILLPLLYIWIFVLCMKYALTGRIETETILRLIRNKS